MINVFDKLDGKSLPAGFQWLNEPSSWVFRQGVLEVWAEGKTDFFRDPAGPAPQHNAHFFYTKRDGDFTFATFVQVDMQADFDAGCLLVMVDEENWAKLCLENCYEKPMLVSVVTAGVSDDTISAEVPKEGVHLRITRFGDCFAFHYSLDGEWWQLIRYFRLQAARPIKVGPAAQAPTGEGCQVSFRHLSVSPKPVRDIRSGK
ncbi:MAG TPA: DUF1349 domain-containing protein [Firmicutes bacterium]|nr:DUF1349 domain-containing protein [Bacillota bacterium]